MKINEKRARGIKYKKGDTEIVFATDRNVPSDVIEFWVKTKIKKLPTAEDLVNEVKNEKAGMDST